MSHLPPNLLLEALWRGDGVYQLGTLEREPPKGGKSGPTGKFTNIPVKAADDPDALARSKSAEGLEVYFACAEYLTGLNRKAENVRGAWGFWLDLDCSDEKAAKGKGYLTQEAAAVALDKFLDETWLPAPTHIVDSGGGLHVYWALDEFIERPEWKSYAEKLETLTRYHGLLADDSRTADIASVLRVPGTMNYKYAPPREVKLISAKAAISTYVMKTFIDVAMSDIPSKPAKTSGQSAYGAEPETPEAVARVKSALAAIDPDCDREMWLKVCFAIRSTGWGCADELALRWSKGDFR